MPVGWPFLLSLMSVFVGLGAEQLTKEATVLRGLPNSAQKGLRKTGSHGGGRSLPSACLGTYPAASSPGICPTGWGVPPPPSRHFIPGISGWFVGLTCLPQPHSHSGVLLCAPEGAGALMPLPLG